MKVKMYLRSCTSAEKSAIFSVSDSAKATEKVIVVGRKSAVVNGVSSPLSLC